MSKYTVHSAYSALQLRFGILVDNFMLHIWKSHVPLLTVWQVYQITQVVINGKTKCRIHMDFVYAK